MGGARGGRVLVTGGAGFIGTHTVAALTAESYRVMVVDDLRHACGATLASDAELVAADLVSPTTADAVRRFQPERVIHLAAQGGVLRSVRDPVADARANVLATVTVLQLCVEVGCRRLLFASSGGAIYGLTAPMPFREASCPKPVSPYGAAKLACEGYLAMYGRTFGLNSLALRYANVYGPFQDGTGEAGLVAITCRRLLQAQPAQISGDGEQTRDFVYIEDVIEATVRALAADATGVVNIGTGRETTVADVVARLIKVAGRSDAPMRSPARAGEMRHVCLCPHRAERLLGWRASTPVGPGLTKTFNSYSAAEQTAPPREGPVR